MVCTYRKGECCRKADGSPQFPVSAQMAAPTPISVLCSGYGDLHMELEEHRPWSQVFAVLPPQGALAKILSWPAQKRGLWETGSEHHGENTTGVLLGPQSWARVHGLLSFSSYSRILFYCWQRGEHVSICCLRAGCPVWPQLWPQLSSMFPWTGNRPEEMVGSFQTLSQCGNRGRQWSDKAM